MIQCIWHAWLGFWGVHRQDALDLFIIVGPILSLIAAGCAAYVAWKVGKNQDQLTRSQLKQDLFDKRYAVYAAVHQYKVILRPLRSGTLALPGRYFEMGSVSATSPRRTIPISTSDVNTLVIEPISKIVVSSSGRASPLSRAP